MLKWLVVRRREAIGRQRGQSFLELAILIPLLMVLFLGALDAGRIFYYHTAVANATRAGGTYGINARLLPGPDDAWRQEQIKQAVVNEIHTQVPELAITDVTVELLGGATEILEGGQVKVTVEYTFDLLLPWEHLWGSAVVFDYSSIVRFI